MMRFRTGLALLGVLVTAACGDPATDDHRGYTKAPLENPGLFIRSEEEHPLRQFGRPLLPAAEEVQPASESQPSAAPAGS